MADRYAWHRPEVLEQDAWRNRIGGAMLAYALGPDLSRLRAVDVSVEREAAPGVVSARLTLETPKREP